MLAPDKSRRCVCRNKFHVTFVATVYFGTFDITIVGEYIEALEVGDGRIIIGTHNATSRGYDESDDMFIIKCWLGESRFQRGRDWINPRVWDLDCPSFSRKFANNPQRFCGSPKFDVVFSAAVNHAPLPLGNPLQHWDELGMLLDTAVKYQRETTGVND